MRERGRGERSRWCSLLWSICNGVRVRRTGNRRLGFPILGVIRVSVMIAVVSPCIRVWRS